ncbi:MAG TPA: hypothetical protein VF134_08445 [Candidatus Dormibacteraeota bacterium]
MRRVRLLLVCWLVVACGNPAPAPTSVPTTPPPDLVFVPTGSGIQVNEVREGTPLAGFLGSFDASLNAGGDLSEAYSVTNVNVYRIRVGRPFQVEPTDRPSGAQPYQVALVPAPGLRTFVGARTVLVTLSADGRLAGYQNGSKIWERATSLRVLRRVDDLAVLGGGDAWSELVPESGELTALAGGCAAGPVAHFGGALVWGCGLPSGTPFSPHPGVLTWADGSVYRLDASGKPAAAPRGAGGGRPAASPDGQRLYWPADFPPASGMASSRDGNFLYAIGGGRLRVLVTSTRKVVRDFMVEGSDIVLVAGG